MMTNQEIFDTVAAHLLTQMRKSEDSERCLYRSREGLKCAVGALIPDGLYNPDIERQSVGDPRVDEVLSAAGINLGESRNLVHDLQCIHDDDPVDKWHYELRLLARRFRLGTSVLGRFSQDGEQ